MSKDFGPVSGYLDPQNRAWEQVTWRTGRPVLDKELNLAGELFLRQLYRSGQICSGFIFSRDYFSPDVFPVAPAGDYVTEPGNFRNAQPSSSTVSNTFYFGPRQVCHVSDMLVTVANKDNEWLPITLPAAPTGVADKRWDFVFLEVWRAPLTGDAATDTTNGVRDSNGKIFYNGWVDSDTADNFADDVLDPGAGAETSRRVQVQWRVRVVSGVDLDSTPDPLDDTTNVLSQGPASSPTTNTYTNQASFGDPGLWVSTGHTVPVDGTIFAVPICAVARRNDQAWDQDTNQNGGSSRPDGYSEDIVQERDIVDLRKTVSASWDLPSLLKRNFEWLMDGKLKTSWEDHNLGGGERCVWYTQIDEIGPTDTPGATRIDQPDSWKKHFSDAPTENEHYQVIQLADRTVSTSPTDWQEGDQFRVALPVSSDGILDAVLEMGLYSGVSNPYYTVTGLNGKTLTFTITAGFNTTFTLAQRQEEVFVRLGVSYTGGVGLSRTPHFYEESVVTGATFGSLDTGDNAVYESVPPSSTTGFDSSSKFFKPSRAVTLILNRTYTSFSIASRTTTTTVMPYDISSVQGIFDAVADPGKTTNLFVSVSGNVITHSAVPATHNDMLVDFTSKEPIPEGDQVSLYYRTPAHQTLNVTSSGLNLSLAKVHILHAPDWLYTVTAGSGSHVPGYPWVSPGSEIPIRNATYSAGDHFLDLNQPVNVDDFGTDAQLIRLPLTIPLANVPYLNLTTPGSDGEGRSYYSAVGSTDYDDLIDGTPTSYEPSVFAKNLQAAFPHKVVYPTIGLCVEDTKLGKRGTLLLVVFSRMGVDASNSIVLDSSNDACVSIYRLKGNPIVSPRKYQLGLSLVEV